MNRSQKIRTALAASALSGGAALALIGTSGPAVAFFSGDLYLDVDHGAQASIVAKGAAIEVPVSYTCTSDRAYLSVSVVEKAGSETASGYSYTSVPCTGGTIRTTLTVKAEDKLFKTGEGYIEAVLSGCDNNYSVCGSDTSAGTIKITK